MTKDGTGKMIPAVVIRANDNCFLDVIRSLSRAGIPAIPAIFTWPGAGEWISEKSAYFKNPILITNPGTDEQKAKEQMIELGKDLLHKYGQKCLLISTSDTALGFAQKYFNEFSMYFLQMGHGNFDVPCLNMLDKGNFADALENHRVSTPLARTVRTEHDIEQAVKGMIYPCVYKPVLKDVTNSFQQSHNGNKAVECHTQMELDLALRNEISKGFHLVVQEKIVFDRIEDEVSCYIYRDANGDVRMASGLHKVYEYPVPYGTGVVCKQFGADELFEQACRVLDATDWRGFLGIEFMYDRKNNRWVIIEANMRPWISVNFQTSLGFNYIEMLYRDMSGTLPAFTKPVISSNMDYYYMSVSAYINKLVNELQDDRVAIQTVDQFIEHHAGHIVFSYFAPDDEAPGEYEYALMQKKYPSCNDVLNTLYLRMKENNRLFRESEMMK